MNEKIRMPPINTLYDWVQLNGLIHSCKSLGLLLSESDLLFRRSGSRRHFLHRSICSIPQSAGYPILCYEWRLHVQEERILLIAVIVVVPSLSPDLRKTIALTSPMMTTLLRLSN